MTGQELTGNPPRPQAWRIYLAFMVVVVVLVCALAGAAFESERSRLHQIAEAAALDDMRILADNIDDQIDRIDMALQSVVLYQRNLVANDEAGARGLGNFLADQRSLVPDLDHLRITDREGMTRDGSPANPQFGISHADHDFFRRPRDSAASGLVVSGPVQGQVSGKWSMVFSRRLQDAEGRFSGIVFGAMPVENFGRTLARFNPQAGDAATLRTTNTALVYRSPPPTGPDGAVGSIAPALRERFASGAFGLLDAPAGASAPATLHVFRKLERHAFYVFAERTLDGTISETRRYALMLAGLGGLLILINATAAAQIYRSSERRKKAERALSASEERLAYAIDAGNDGVWDINLLTHEASYSGSYCRMLGYQRGELCTGDTVLAEHLHPQDRAGTLDAITRGLASTGQFDLEFRMRTRDGEHKWVQSRGKLVARQADGRPERVVGTLTDLTARKRLELELRASLEQLTALLETAPVGIILVVDRQIVRSNTKAEELFGYAPGELIGQSTRNWYHDDASFVRTGEEVAAAMRQGRVDQREFELLRKDGSGFFARVTARALDPADPTQGILCIVDDITSERDAAAAMARARTLAEETAQTKAEFLANMSHEIRTPMNAVIGMTHLALKTTLTTRQRDYLKKIQTSSQHLLGVINDILDFSKIEAGKMRVEHIEFELEKVLENVSGLIVERAAAKGIELIVQVDPDVPATLVGDPLRVGQVLINYANNALKFTSKGEINLHVSLQSAIDDDLVLRFEVRDTGIGIAEEDLHLLFMSFQQMDGSTTRKFGGTGLGLAISKNLAKLMGGDVGVFSKLGGGSTFWFTARMGRGRVANKPLPLPSPDLRGRRVLVVDDNDSARDVMCNMLNSMTFTAGATASGADALSELRRASAAGTAYDAVLLDWQMPGMDGVATAHAIQRLSLEPPPRMVMVTAYGREEVVRPSQDAGIEEILVKPVNPSVLFDALMRSFGIERSEAPSPQEPVVTRTSDFAAIAGARVLLVEDNELNQEVALELLRDIGLQVDLAPDGAIALEKAATQTYDIVLMDMQMPVMDGLTATREIHKLPQCEALPIVAMTANAMAGDRDRCLAAGMVDHLAKPIDPAVLGATLLQWIPARPASRSDLAVASAPGPVAAYPVGLDGIAGLDTLVGLRQAMGRESLYRSLLARFVNGQRDFSMRMAEALAAHDQATAERLAHTLKGVAGQIGARELQGLGSQLEASIRSQAPRRALETLQAHLGLALDQLIKAIEPRLSDRAPPIADTVVDQDQLLDVCRRLARHLASGDVGASAVLEDNSALLQAGLGDSFAAIAAAINDYAFDEGLALLRDATDRLALAR